MMPELIPLPATTDPRNAVDELRWPTNSRVKPKVHAQPALLGDVARSALGGGADFGEPGAQVFERASGGQVVLGLVRAVEVEVERIVPQAGGGEALFQRVARAHEVARRGVEVSMRP